MEKRKKKNHLKKEALMSQKSFFTVVFLLILVLAAIIFSKFIYVQTKPVVESPRTEMKKLPLDVKKALKKTPVASNTATLRVPILMYHYIEYITDKRDTLRAQLNVSPNVFEKQIQTLQKDGYTFLTAKELGEIMDNKMQLPEKPILLTFDDGHRDFATSVLPILKKYHVKATAYVIPGFLEGSDFMTKSQLRDVINSGLVDVGAHTVHHISLKGSLYSIVHYEVNESKDMLEKDYNIKVVSFAYPNGAFDQQAVDIVKADGYTTAVSTIPGIEQNQQNRFFLYRLRPGYRDGELLLSYLKQNAFKPW